MNILTGIFGAAGGFTACYLLFKYANRYRRRNRRRDVKTMDVVLVTIAIFLCLFAGVMICLYVRTGGIPDTLCTCVFAACGGECGVMGWIRTTKDRQRERGYEIADREHQERVNQKGGEDL